MPQNVAVPGLAIANTKEYAKQQYSKMLEDVDAAVTRSSGHGADHSTQDRQSPVQLHSPEGEHRSGGAEAQRKDSRGDRRADTWRNVDAHPDSDGRHQSRHRYDSERSRSEQQGRRHDRGAGGKHDSRRRSRSVDSQGQVGRPARGRSSRDRGRSPPRGDWPRERKGRDLPEAPDVSAVYKGTVKNTARHGAYVELAGFRSRVEGMVHVSNLSNRRVNDVTEVCKRGDEVWVKVLSIQPPPPGQARARIDLSLRDVDQSTGKDLLPVHDTALHPIGVPCAMACCCTRSRELGLLHIRGRYVRWTATLSRPRSTSYRYRPSRPVWSEGSRASLKAQAPQARDVGGRDI